MGVHPARILRQRSIPPPSGLRRKAGEEDPGGWRAGSDESSLPGWRVDWRGGARWCRDKDTLETQDDSPRVCDIMSVMLYVMMFILLLLFAVFMSFFTVISGSAYMTVT